MNKQEKKKEGYKVWGVFFWIFIIFCFLNYLINYSRFVYNFSIGYYYSTIGEIIGGCVLLPALAFYFGFVPQTKKGIKIKNYTVIKYVFIIYLILIFLLQVIMSATSNVAYAIQ